MYFFRILLKSSAKNHAIMISKRTVHTSSPFFISPESYEDYQNSLPVIMENVFDKSFKSSEVVDRMKRIIDYNVSGGKKIRSALNLYAYESIMGAENSLQDIRALAWAVEMVHSCFIILDDIQDRAEIRRKKKCWHLLPDVGTQAVNDVSLLRCFINEVLRNYFADKKFFKDFLYLFDKAFHYTAIGQHLDSVTSKSRNSNYDHFTVERYTTITDYKTGYYTFQFPLHLALTLANKTEMEALSYVDNICADMGRLMQIKNDYLDCYGGDRTGKTCTDIEEGKCTWLAVSALQRCSPAQRVVFTACYGSREPAHIERIKRLYDQLHLPQLYEQNARGTYDEIARKAQFSKTFPPEMFIRVVDTILGNN